MLEIQPTYQVRQDVCVGAPWDGVLEAFDEIMAGAYSVSLMGDPGSPILMQIWQKTRVGSGTGTEPPAPAPESLQGGLKHPEPVHALIGAVEAALAEFGARPHWGKLHRFSPDDLARAFPRLSDALDLALRLDPAGKFASDGL